MSYRPPDQALSEYCITVREGIEKLETAIINRFEARNEWAQEHLHRLGELMKELVSLKLQLIRLEQETW